MAYLIRARWDQRPSVRYQDLSSYEAIQHMFKANYSITQMVHGDDLDLAKAIIAFINSNGILMQWFETKLGYVFAIETDMNLFLLNFPQFERVAFQP